LIVEFAEICKKPHGQRNSAGTHGEMGSAPDSILSFAEAQKADVIVMGTHGGRGYDRLTLGSVTNRVMRTAPCPVLAVCNAPRDSMPEGQEHG
jgi:nucleotide-binding universal stress UspA family protein